MLERMEQRKRWGKRRARGTSRNIVTVEKKGHSKTKKEGKRPLGAKGSER